VFHFRSKEGLCLASLALLLVLMHNSHGESPARPPLSERAFLFTWPGQPEEESLLEDHGPLVTDRPSFTDASRPVGDPVTLVELGYTYSYNGAPSPYTSSHSYPEVAIRQGFLANWLELRATLNATSSHLADEDNTALGNLELGNRLGLTPQFGVLPEISITPHLRLPTGTGDLRYHHYLPGMSLSYSWSLSDRYSLAGSSQVYQDENPDSHARYTEWLHSVVGTWNATSNVALWGEFAGFFRGSPSDQSDTYYADVGVLYLLGPDSQLDIRLGSELQDTFGRNIFSGIGFSIRYQ
jgi:hypothetical protein